MKNPPVLLLFRKIDGHFVEVSNYLHYAAPISDVLFLFGIDWSTLPQNIEYMRIRTDNEIIEYKRDSLVQIRMNVYKLLKF